MKKLLLTLAVIGAASFAFAGEAKKSEPAKDAKTCSCKHENGTTCGQDCSCCGEKGACAMEKKADDKPAKKD